jgi:exopolysaccharide production protein ExoQ
MTPGAALPLYAPASAGRPARWLVYALCAAALFVFSYGSEYTWSEIYRASSEAYASQLDQVVKESAAGNRSRQAAAISLGLVGALALLTRRGAVRLRPIGALGALVLAYVVLLVVSVGWAEEPEISVRRVIATSMLVLGVAGLARVLPRDALVSFALLGSAAYVLVAIAVEVAGGGDIPLLAPEYRLSGVYHPNTLGTFAAILVMAATCTDGRKVRPWLLAIAVVGGATVLLLTRSRQAVAGLVLALTIRSLVAARLSRTAFALALTAWIGCAVFIAFGDAAGRAVLDTLLSGRIDSDVGTLSGRTELWGELLRHVGQRPVLGYGFGSFWNARHIQEMYAALRWPVIDAHSTYFQQLLDLGVFGLALYLLVVAAALQRAIRGLRATGDRAYGFMICVLVHLSAVGVLETLHPNPAFPTFLLWWTLAFLAFREVTPSGDRSRCAST